MNQKEQKCNIVLFRFLHVINFRFCKHVKIKISLSNFFQVPPSFLPPSSNFFSGGSLYLNKGDSFCKNGTGYLEIYRVFKNEILQ